MTRGKKAVILLPGEKGTKMKVLGEMTGGRKIIAEWTTAITDATNQEIQDSDQEMTYHGDGLVSGLLKST